MLTEVYVSNSARSNDAGRSKNRFRQLAHPLD